MLSLEYIAGLFDGEGCVFIGRVKRTKNGNIGERLSAQITNIYLPVLQELKAQFGGYIFTRPPTNGRSVYNWIIHTNTAFSFITLIEPHCIIKKDQIHLVFEYYEKFRSGKRRNTPYTIEETNLRDFYFNELRRLKRLAYV